MKVLLWEYIIQEWVEYPDSNSLGTIRWYEIVDIEFFWLDSNDTPIERMGSIQYRHYDEALEYMNEDDDIQFVINHLNQQKLATPENISWVYFWISYQHDEWTKRYEQRKAAREAEAVNA